MMSGTDPMAMFQQLFQPGPASTPPQGLPPTQGSLAASPGLAQPTTTIGDLIQDRFATPIRPTSVTPADPMATAVKEAKTRYPWLKRFDKVAITKGNGPYESESYMPDATDNPKPGHYTVEVRSDNMKKNPQQWADLLGREGLDWLARSDPVFQSTAQQFVASMSDKQIKRSRERFKEEGSKGTFDDFMREAEAQEYIGGYLTPQAAPGWTGPKGEGQYTPEQIRLLEQLRAYLHR